MGAPTLYKEEYCNRMISYFKKEPFKRVKVTTKSPKTGYSEKVDWKLMMTPLPKFVEFADLIDVSLSTIRNWRKKHPKFNEAFEECQERLKWILVDGGLAGTYNNAMAIFTIKNISDWRDQRELAISGSNAGLVFLPKEYGKQKNKSKLQTSQRNTNRSIKKK